MNTTLLEPKQKTSFSLTSNKRIDWNHQANINCLKMLRKGCFYYSTISKITKLSLGQVALRAKRKELLAKDIRTGNSEITKVWISKYIVVNYRKPNPLPNYPYNTHRTS